MDDIYLLLVLVSLVCIVVGLVRPTIFSRYLGAGVTRKRTSITFFLLAFISFVMFGITTDANEEAEQKKISQQATQLQSAVEEKNSIAPEAVTKPDTMPAEGALVVKETKRAEETYEVVRVVDGDTLTLKMGDTTETLRLIGMDTPETVDPRKQVQCFGKEASAKAKETLAGKKVRIEADPSQGERDKYNRLLRYIFLEDGTFYNKLMIEEGYAHEYTYNTPYKYQTEFKEAETKAREGKKGFWGDVCDGNTEQSASSAQASTLAPVIVAPVAPKTSSEYSCNCSKTCANMSSCAEAQYQLNSCGCSARDADHDGVACDSDCQ